MDGTGAGARTVAACKYTSNPPVACDSPALTDCLWFQAPITLAVPTLQLTSSTPARTVTDPYEPRGAIWREDCAETCLHIIVANVMTHTPVSFTLELTGPIWESLAAPNATRIFDGQYTIPISSAAEQAGGLLSDWVDAGGTNVVRTQAIWSSLWSI